MIGVLRPTTDDLVHVASLAGRVLLGIAALHVPAIVLSLALGEWNDAAAMTIGATLALVVGIAASSQTESDRALSWAEGSVTVALSWLVAPLPIAVSFHLSGHMGSYLDAVFDAMSGLTTSGLSLLQDVDHAGAGLQLLRHLTHFAGGQGIIVVVLMLLSTGGPHVGTLLTSEGRQERLAPNAIRTARYVYLIASAWLVAGSAALWVALRVAGLDAGRSLLHAVTLFMAAFDTGGFSIHSTSVAYYHSVSVEIVLSVLMIAGALSFPLHHQLWRRRFRSASEDLDLRTFFVTTTLLSTAAVVALAANSVYDTTPELVRKGAFTVLSAATGTGFGVIAPQTYASWGQIAPAVVVAAMGIGAMAGSTAGGIKTIRIGLTAKAVLRDIRSALLPESAVVVATYHARRDRLVTDEQVTGAVVTTLLFLGTYLAGALLAMFHGSTLEQGLFESTSATAAVGLSVGVLSPGSPVSLKVVTVLQMWAGRLEFLAAFAMAAYVVQAARADRHLQRR